HTTVEFNYGATAAYEKPAVTALQSPLSSSGVTTVTRFVADATNPTYYRVTATNGHYIVFDAGKSFTTTAAPGKKILSSTDANLPKSIPDNLPAGAASSLTLGVNDCPVVKGVEIYVNASHPSLTELTYRLDHATETADFVSSNTGTSSNFNNTAGAGLWQLTVADNQPGNTGTLEGWGMVFSCAARLDVNKTGTGTITSSTTGGAGSIACGDTCFSEFDLDSSVTLTATTTGNWAFDNWSGSCTCTYLNCPAAGACSLLMNAGKSATAEFVEIADFITYTMPDNSVYFVDQSKHSPAAWLWDFGDTPNNTSTLQDPIYSYQSVAAPFTVTLTASVGAQQHSVQKTVSPLVCGETSLAKITATYATLQEAYNAAGAGSEIMVHARPATSPITEGFPFDTNANNIIISGGFDCDFLINPSFTILGWPMTIGGNGSVTVEGLIIQ
ncbi:MAG: hypothetical protein C0402_00640, partial [Thermodesulfovibrio sp.]|nr:hypothetical protein [Thermodesulfovibrio sp.]